MDTVQLPCTHCGQLMAVSVAHMGMQVHCPHCDGIVTVPPAEVMSDKTMADKSWLEKPEGAPASAPRPAAKKPAEAERGDDLFQEGPAAPAAKDKHAYQPTWAPSSHEEPPAEPEDDGELPLAPITQHRPKQSVLVPILLMFLIPYALATTGFIAWLVYQNKTNTFDPFERLPDKPGDGSPQQMKREQIQHDWPLSAKLQTSLNAPITVGDVEVTPVKVERNSRKDLVLVMRMKNVSHSNVAFNPMQEDFCVFREGITALRPYTFLQPLTPKSGEHPKGGERLYGGFLDWSIDDGGTEKLVNHSHRLQPGQEMTIRLTTRSDDNKRARWLLDNPQDVLWRVQVRRGFVSTRHGPKSATAVIGVRFNTAAIEG